MTFKIRIGNIVDVVFKDSRMEDAKMIHTPQGEGDLFQVSWMNNPYNSHFLYFERTDPSPYKEQTK